VTGCYMPWLQPGQTLPSKGTTIHGRFCLFGSHGAPLQRNSVPDRAGNLLELVVMDRPTSPAVIHAMPMRATYRRLLPKGRREQT
jgi:hypothetical protein